MENRTDISAVIIANNEEDNITECLESVKWTDEIILVDSESTDSTVKIASSFTENVFVKKWEGYAPQRKFALDKVNTSWAFVIDADERCTSELKDEIRSVIKSPDAKDGYNIPRKSFFLGKWIKHSGWYPGYQLRLFKTDKVSIEPKLVHEYYTVNGSIGALKSDLLHYTVKSLSAFMTKINDYSTLAAEEKRDGKRVGITDLLVRPPLAFFREYFFKFGFLDGVHGLMVAYFNSITNVLIYMKTREIQNSK